MLQWDKLLSYCSARTSLYIYAKKRLDQSWIKRSVRVVLFLMKTQIFSTDLDVDAVGVFKREIKIQQCDKARYHSDITDIEKGRTD